MTILQGVKNIRPHLANVDNVPLLVPLFTSCTPPAITEMITIMQVCPVTLLYSAVARAKKRHIYLLERIPGSIVF